MSILEEVDAIVDATGFRAAPPDAPARYDLEVNGVERADILRFQVNVQAVGPRWIDIIIKGVLAVGDVVELFEWLEGAGSRERIFRGHVARSAPFRALAVEDETA